MTNLAEALPAQQERCREILANALSIGVHGAFLVACLRADLAKADRAVMSGDVVDMLRSYETLKAYKE